MVQVKKLAQHMSIVHGEGQRLPCDVPGCTTTFTNRTHKRKHIESVHEGTRSRCEVCGKEVANLTVHMRLVHEGVRAFACPVCKKTFQSASYRRNLSQFFSC